MAATTTVSPRIQQGRRTVTRPWRGARVIAVAAVVVAGFGSVAAIDRSTSISTTCTAQDPATGASVTGPLNLVPASARGDIALPERTAGGQSSSGDRYAVFCGGVLSNIKSTNHG